MDRRLRFVLAAASLAVLSLVVAAPSSASLTAPIPDTTSVGVPVPAFHWTSVTGAANYQFQLSDTADFAATEVDTTSKNTYLTLTKIVGDCSCFWRVRALTATGSAGPWSDLVEWDKVSTPPTPTLPADGDTVSYPTPVVLRWGAVDGAAKYEVYIGTDPGLSGVSPVETSATSYAPSNWLSPGTHYWAVVTKDAEGGFSQASSVQSFIWDWPSTVSGLTVTDTNPYGDGVVYEPRFSWDAVPGAVKYNVDLSIDNTFAIGSTTSYTTIATSFSPTALLNNANYYWRVRAVDPNNGVGDWTYGGDQPAPGDVVPVTYDVGSPSVQNLRMMDNAGDPGTDFDGDSSNGYQTQEPIVTWDPVPGAGSYQVDVREYDDTLGCAWSGFLNQKKWVSYTQDTYWTPLGTGRSSGMTVLPGKTPIDDGFSTKLVAGTRYCVRVKPVRDNGVEAPWTYMDPSDDGTTWGFQFDSYPSGNACSPTCASSAYLGSDDYLTPQSGSTSTAMPLFTWNPIAGMGSYYVVVATDAAMTHVVDYAWTQVPAYAPRTANTTIKSYADSTSHYYWQVFPAATVDGQAANGVPGSGTIPWFIKHTIPPAPIAPLTGDTVHGQPTFAWAPVMGATEYYLEISDDPNFPVGSHILEKVTSTYATTYTSLANNLPQGTLYWHVRAIDGGNTGLSWSPAQQFTQTYDAPTFDLLSNPTVGSRPPTIYWNPVPGAISYDVHVICPSGGIGCTDGTGLEQPAGSFTKLTGLGDFGWQVRANFPKSFGSIHGTYSAVQTYTHTIPDPTNPLTLKTATGLLFSWDSMSGAEKYKVQISRVSSFTTQILGGNFTTETTSYAPPLNTTDYLNGGTFYWRVASVDSDNNTGQWSPAQSVSLPAKLAESTNPASLRHGVYTTITVTVKDFAGHIIAGARVVPSGCHVATTAHLTGAKGTTTFKLKPTVAGKVTFSASKTGYQSTTKVISSF